MSFGVANKYMFQHFATYACQRHQSIISSIILLHFNEQGKMACSQLSCTMTQVNDSLEMSDNMGDLRAASLQYSCIQSVHQDQVRYAHLVLLVSMYYYAL